MYIYINIYLYIYIYIYIYIYVICIYGLNPKKYKHLLVYLRIRFLYKDRGKVRTRENI